MAQAKISEQAAVTPPDAGKLKRSIRMKDLLGNDGDKIKARLALAWAVGKPQAEQEIVAGVIVGPIYEVRERTFEDPRDNSIVTVLQAFGEFEAVSALSGEVLTSTAADLPTYYLEGVQAALDNGGVNSVLMAVEILLVATGKSIPVAYEVRNIMPPQPDSPLNRIKMTLAKANRLGKLPPPVAIEAIAAPASQGDEPMKHPSAE